MSSKAIDTDLYAPDRSSPISTSEERSRTPVTIKHLRVHHPSGSSGTEFEETEADTGRANDRGHARNRSRRIRLNRSTLHPSPLFVLSSSLLRHMQKIQTILVGTAAFLFLLQVMLQLLGNGSAERSDAEIMRGMEHTFRSNPRFSASHERFTQFQTISSSYRLKATKLLPANQQPPIVRCMYQKDQTDTNTLAWCLMKAYFKEILAQLPSLVQFRRVREDNHCNQRLILNIDSHTTTAMTPGTMLRSYLSFLSFAGILGADVIGSRHNRNDHPYWRWPREEHRSQWMWKKVTNDTQYTARFEQESHVYKYDFGTWLANWQWESKPQWSEECNWNTAARSKVLKHDRVIGRTPAGGYSTPAELHSDLQQLIQAIDPLLVKPFEGLKEPPPFQPDPPLHDRLMSFLSASETFPNTSHITQNMAGANVVLPGWETSAFMDSRILLVLEIRFWLRHTMQQMIYSGIVDDILPVLQPTTKRAAWRARLDNTFPSPQAVSTNAEQKMRAGVHSTYIMHGFDTNTFPPPTSNPRTDKERWFLKRSFPEQSDTFNSYSAVFESYFSTMLHWAIVIHQPARIRKIRVPSSVPSASPKYFRSPWTSSPPDMNIGVPVEYVDHVITIEAVVAAFKRVHENLSQELREKLVVTVFFDGIGFEESDLEPMKVEFLKLSVQVRLQLNVPLAVSVQQVALSDIQAYFCLEEEPYETQASESFHQGTCGMAAFFRSEPVKIMLQSNNLPKLYPYVRNVFRMELIRSPQAKTVAVDDAQLYAVDLGRWNGNDTASQMQALRTLYPLMPLKELKLVHLEDLKQVVAFSSPVKSSSDKRDTDHSNELRAIIAAIRTAYDRKQRRLRLGGIPIFTENYSPDYPRHRIIVPES